MDRRHESKRVKNKNYKCKLNLKYILNDVEETESLMGQINILH